MLNAFPRVRRLLLTADPLGGVWTYALELARALQQHGVQVVLATMGGPVMASQRAEVRRISGLTVCESSFKLEWMENPWSDVERAGDWLLGLEEAVLPDVVHLNSYVHGALSWHSPTLVVGHSCVSSWWEAVKGQAAPASWQYYRDLVARGLHAADLVLAPTQAMLSALEQHYGRLRRGRVVPNGRDPALFAPADKQPFILAVGRLWDEAKNIEMLDTVAPSLSWPIYVAGEERHLVAGRVHYRSLRPLGRLSSPLLASRLSRAAIYALPARYEPFGLSVLEAGLAGCALVLGDIPSLRETWDGAAQFVPPDDAETLRKTLQTLIQNPSELAWFAAAARERALQYSPERMLIGYLGAYEELLQARHRRPGHRHSSALDQDAWRKTTPVTGG
jgi:glycosyltransferase involved in cell wall biosynthesis